MTSSRMVSLALIVLLACPAWAGRYTKTAVDALGLTEAYSVNHTGNIVVGRAAVTGTNGRAAFWKSGVGTTFLQWTNGDYASGWIQHITESDEMLFSRGNVGSPELWKYSLSENSFEQLPNANYGSHGGTPSIHRIKDSNSSGSLLGYMTFGFDFGPPVEEPTVWRKSGNTWSAEWIRGTSGFVYSLDEAGKVYGQSASLQASIWDSSLTKRDLPLPSGFLGGKAYGRLQNGKIVGQIANSTAWYMAVWDNETSIPSTTFFGSRAMIESPSLSASDVLLLTESGAQRRTSTWTPSEGAMELSSQVIGGLPSNLTSIYAGDGGHLIVNNALDFYLLTPVPEPGSLLALSAGVGLILQRRRR